MAGSTTLTISNEALSANLFDQIADLRNTRHKPYRLVEAMLRNCDKTTKPGERMIVRWQTENHSVPTRAVHGYEQFNDFAQPTLTPGFQNWAIVVQPIFISEIDEIKNNGGVIPLLRTRVEAVEKHMHQQMQDVLLKGALASGTWGGVPGFEDYLSLNGADQATGIIEDQAAGTNVLHNLAKTSYPVATHPQLHNDFYDAANDASANLLNNLYASTVAQQDKDGDPSPSESEWYISLNAANFLKQSLRGFEQYTMDGTMDDGKRTPNMYAGVPVIPVSTLPTLGSGSTSNPWSAVRVNWKRGVRFRAYSGWLFDYTKFIDLPGTTGNVRYSLGRLWGNLVGLQPGLCSLIVDAETF